MIPSAPGQEWGSLPISQNSHVPPVWGQARNTRWSSRITTQTPFGYPPPIKATKLKCLLPNFWRSKGIQFDKKSLKVNGRLIEPAAFHGLVIQAGGFENVGLVDFLCP